MATRKQKIIAKVDDLFTEPADGWDSMTIDELEALYAEVPSEQPDEDTEPEDAPESEDFPTPPQPNLDLG